MQSLHVAGSQQYYHKHQSRSEPPVQSGLSVLTKGRRFPLSVLAHCITIAAQTNPSGLKELIYQLSQGKKREGSCQSGGDYITLFQEMYPQIPRNAAMAR